MVTMYDFIRSVYPNAILAVDYLLRDDGNGPFVSYWSESLGTQPTQEKIDALRPTLERIALKNKIAKLRWDHETQGITIGDQPVSTLREEMPVWQGMLLDMTLQPGVRTEYEYKPRNGANVVLTVEQVQRCYQCFAWYVSACFATERYLYGLIDAGTPLEQVEAMLDSVWPQTEFEWAAP